MPNSFGNLNPKNIRDICKTVRKYWNKDFGFHAHDNCGLALQNCMSAINNGAKLIDSTIQGMGRGAGNVTTEDLICNISEKKESKYNPNPIYFLAENIFKELKNKFGWGKSIYYRLSAKKNIHPSYIQEMVTDKRYNHENIINIIDVLSKIKGSSYNPLALKKLLNENITLKNNWNANNWCSNKDVLIIGQGKSVFKYKEKIIKFIHNTNCKVLALNINRTIENNLIDFYVACHEMRIMIDFKEYKNISKKLILPLDRFKNILNKKLSKSIKNYGMVIKKDSFNYFSKYCELPKNLAIGYAICISMAGNAKNIFLAGFDGYKNRKSLNSEMNNYLKFINQKTPGLKLKSITPINYKNYKIEKR